MKYKIVVWDADFQETFELPKDGRGLSDREAVELAGERWVLNYPMDIVMLVEVPE